MDGLRGFSDMGGYAAYVWGAYGITSLVLVANLLLPYFSQVQLRDRLSRQIRFEQRLDSK